MGMREDYRTLEEFYPDPLQRYMVQYQFGHMFLPAYFQMRFPVDALERLLDGPAEMIQRMVQSRFPMFEEMAGLIPPSPLMLEEVEKMVFRRVRDLDARRVEVGGRAAMLVTMPAPVRPVAAYFVLVVPPSGNEEARRAGNGVRVFTLEASHLSQSPDALVGVLGEWTQSPSTHHNCGGLPGVDAEGFVAAVERALAVPREQRPR